MAPSRGSGVPYRLLQNYCRVRQYSSTSASRSPVDIGRKCQIYVSRSLDPYINLSFEHYLLQKSHADSTVLFLYTNRPCVVIGRNQNPWVEVNLGLLKEGLAGGEPIALVRRRSGGGTVFHDEGNVNYCVICPTQTFDRDKHAQMVVRALQRLGVKAATVNERHDIVLDAGQWVENPDEKPYKISGSAYKLTRLRSLHHGTCLLSSPNIKTLGQYLRSPAKPYIKARGVESVRSPVTNVDVANEAFEEAVIEEFGKMYDSVEPVIVSDETAEIPEVAKGLGEIRSSDWLYTQTPQFTFSSYKPREDGLAGFALPDSLPPNTELSFTARNGAITEAELAIAEDVLDTSSMVGKTIHEIKDWSSVIFQSSSGGASRISKWLNHLFGISSKQ